MKKTWFAFGALALLVVVLGIALWSVSDNIAPEVAQEQVAQALAEEREAADQAMAAKQLELEQKLAELAQAKDAEKAEAVEAANAELEGLKAQLAEKEEAIEAEAGAEELYPSGELIDNVFLGDVISFSLDDGDVEKLLDTEIEFNEEDYDVHEEFVANNGDLVVLYSAVDDEEFGANPYVGLLDKGAIEYRFVFDDPIDMTEISDDEPLSFQFLGVATEIVKADADEVSFRSGNSFYLREGENIDFEGKSVTLGFVSENGRVTVCVDDDCDVIDEYDTEVIGGLDVRAEDILVNSREGVARLVLGEDTLLSLDDGEEWMGNDDSPFDFHIVASGDFLEALVISYEEKRDELDGDYPVLGVGDSLAFPNDYLTLLFSKVLETDYITFDFEFDGFNDELWDETDVDNDECIVVSTNDKDIEILDEEVDEAYVCADGNAYYQDNNGDWYAALVSDVTLVNDDAEYNLAIGGAGLLRIESASDVLIRLDADWANERLGLEEDEAEASDVLLASNGVGNVEYDILTPFGAVLVDVESNADNDEFSLKIPTDRVELELVVY